MKPLKVFLMLVVSSFFSQAWSQAVGGPLSAGGTGCQGESVFFNGLDISLDHFQLKTDSHRGFDRKSCSFSLPVQVDEGYQVGITIPKIDLAMDMPSTDSTLAINAEVFFSGADGPMVSKTLVGPKSSEITLRTKEKMMWAPCGESVILRMNISAILQSQNDVSAGAEINRLHRDPGSLFMVRKCQ